MTSLAQLIEQFDHNPAVSVPPDWFQGRTVYGGLSAALALQSVLKSGLGVLPPLKSAHVTFVGPAAPPLVFRSRLLRAGKSVSTVAVECESEAGAALNALFMFGQGRESAIHYNDVTAPNVPPPQDCPAWPARGIPPFIQNFELRTAGKALPFSQAPEGELLVWVRHKDAAGVDPMVALVGIADCLPPAAMIFFTTPAPLSSITWAFDILESPPASDEWLLLRSKLEHAQNGYSTQHMDIWTMRGERVVAGRQNIAVFA